MPAWMQSSDEHLGIAEEPMNDVVFHADVPPRRMSAVRVMMNQSAEFQPPAHSIRPRSSVTNASGFTKRRRSRAIHGDSPLAVK